MDFKSILAKAVAQLNAEKKESELSREFSYRGGSVGIKLSEQEYAGQCARKALARALGRFNDVEPSLSLMFTAGEVNEDRWETYFKAAGLDVRKADDAIEWTTDSGVKVTGSPDGLVYKGDKVIHGIEHKHVSSLWTARDVLFENKPKLDHVIQSAHYSLAMNKLPYSIVYTASTIFTGPEFVTRFAPKPFEENSDGVEYTYYNRTNTKLKSGKYRRSKINLKPEDKDLLPREIWAKYGPDEADFKNTKPFVKQFDLEWKGDTVYVNGKATIVTASSIVEYYEQLDTMQRDKILTPRPLNLDIYGGTKSYSLCDYCDLSPTCDQFERSYDKWVDKIK